MNYFKILIAPDERQVSGFKKGEDFASELSPEQGPVSGADSGTCVDAAKIAAIRAAQLGNFNFRKNYVGV